MSNRFYLPRIERELARLYKMGFKYADVLRREYRELDRLYQGKVNLANMKNFTLGSQAQKYKIYQELDKLPIMELRATLSALCIKRWKDTKRRKQVILKKNFSIK